MRSLSAAAVLLLVATAIALAATPAAAQKKNRTSTAPTRCRFGWVPVSFDSMPWKQPLDPKRRPKLLNLRCTEACSALGLTAVMTGDSDATQQKPLCYFTRKRALGANYNIYGSWYTGEAQDDYESTCRGRVETGQQTVEWAYRWDEPSATTTFGFFCGCSGCTQGCWNNATGSPPLPRLPPNNTGAFNCSAPSAGTPPPYPQANRFWPYWFTGDDFVANTNPNSTAAGACNDPRWGGGANNFPFPICKGRTAAFGEEWGSMDSDFTCKTYNSLVVADDPKFLCTTSPGDKMFSAPPPPGKGRLMGLNPATRLDLVMGATEPELPNREAVQRLAPQILARTEQVLP